MFAPDHRATAGELARVTRPGGHVVLANWTPEGGVGDMFRAMAPFQPAPPPSDPFDWGRQDVVRDLLGDAFELDVSEQTSIFHGESAQASWELFSTSYGPTRTLAESLGDRRGELERAWLDLFESTWATDDGIVQPREYLLVIGRRR